MAGAARYDAVVLGAGHNGLVAAAYLSRAGLRTLVVERRDVVGGAALTGELAPGVRGPVLAHTVGRLRTSVMRDLRLRDHGLQLIRPAVRTYAPRLDGGPGITLWSDPARTAAELRAACPKDGERWVEFDRKVRALASFLAYLQVSTPPDLKTPNAPDALGGLTLVRAFRKLGPKAGREVLRALPMAVADFVEEAFDSDHLRAVIAARGITYTAMGPRSAGTTNVLLNDSAGNDGGAAGQTVFARGGPGALSDALAAAARGFGAEIRCDAGVTAVTSTEGRATGVVLAGGEEIAAGVVVSGLDPKRTAALVDPVELGPTLVWRTGNIRAPGTVAKVNLVLDGPPAFAGGVDERLHGRIVITGGIDHLDRAFDASKYGRASEEPYLEVTIPTLTDPTLAPEGRHVVSVIAQYAPFDLRGSSWNAERSAFGDRVLAVLECVAPGLTARVIERQVATPADLERHFGLTGGHPLHAEPGLDQFFAWRPLLGHARYRFGIEGLYLCGSGAHPGGGITGAPGANAARAILSRKVT